ncbi:MAG: AzlC family ABC transporter permease [Leptotrichiaceae bacterium]|nr:AzlC family ABC transporter permease [Leptotrichiaceae bacterium]
MLQKGRTENYLKGVKDGFGIGIAYIPFGITLGLISKSFGMKSLIMGLMSFTLYAGSGQTLLLKMLYVSKSTFLEIIVSVFMINLRYSLLNLIIYRELKDKASLFEKILVGLGLTDETVVYLRIRKAENPYYMMGVNTLPYIFFGIGSIVGSLFGNLIPEIFSSSMNFILYAAFLSLLVSALKENLKYIRVIVIVLLFKAIFEYVPVSKGWAMILIMFLSSMTYALMTHKEGVKENG